jgi:hypothetical protein
MTDTWMAAECALQIDDSKPIPLLYEPTQSKKGAFYRRLKGSLKGHPLKLADCLQHRYSGCSRQIVRTKKARFGPFLG